MLYLFFFFNQKTAYEMRISDWSSDVCSSDLRTEEGSGDPARAADTGQHSAAIGSRADMTHPRGRRRISNPGSVIPDAGRRSQACAPGHGRSWRGIAEIGRASGRERGCKYV